VRRYRRDSRQPQSTTAHRASYRLGLPYSCHSIGEAVLYTWTNNSTPRSKKGNLRACLR
jgi:hypothetical protein